MLNTLRSCGLDKVEKNLLRKHLQPRDVLIALTFSSILGGNTVLVIFVLHVPKPFLRMIYHHIFHELLQMLQTTCNFPAILKSFWINSCLSGRLRHATWHLPGQDDDIGCKDRFSFTLAIWLGRSSSRSWFTVGIPDSMGSLEGTLLQSFVPTGFVCGDRDDIGKVLFTSIPLRTARVSFSWSTESLENSLHAIH